MKSQYLLIIFFLLISLQFTHTRDYKKLKEQIGISPDDNTISDEDIEELLKRPEYSSIASIVDGKLPSIDLDTTKSSPKPSNKDEKSTSKAEDTPSLPASSSAKPEASHSLSGKSNSSHKKASSSSGSDDHKHSTEHSTEHPTSKSETPTNNFSSNKPSSNLRKSKSLLDEFDQEEKEKIKKEDKFKDFDFISKQQARFLIEILKQPVFYNMLPSQGKQIVDNTKDNFSFKAETNNKINDFIETSLVNSPTSQTFIDSDGKVGRKGVLTLIDPLDGSSKYIFSVSNSKVLVFYKSQSTLTIVKLFRNSNLVIKDVSSTPCFILYSPKENKEGSYFACTSSTQEKEVWLETIRSNLNIE